MKIFHIKYPYSSIDFLKQYNKTPFLKFSYVVVQNVVKTSDFKFLYLTILNIIRFYALHLNLKLYMVLDYALNPFYV